MGYSRLLHFKFVTYLFSLQVTPFDIFFLQVGTQTSVVEMVPGEDLNTLKWEVFVEKAGIWDQADFVKNGFVDHINTTKDTTDYLWYTTRFVPSLDEIIYACPYFLPHDCAT